jgi:hypothetical protein
MYARVVRFTDVTRERIDEIKQRIEESDGPPPGVRASGMQMFFDEQQGTGVFVGFFASEDDLRDADEALGNMDASDTPGTRASIDRCEVVIERDAG